ncbi:MAG: P-II family nitrogen regulator [Chitinophagales bacterium]|nr:P-II family nitrogen regulator [Chitinophagales bacterium]
MRFELLVGFINPDITEKVIITAKESGATGDVIIQGRGSGIEQSSFLGLAILDKVDIVLFIVEEHHTSKIIESVAEKCKIEESGNGVMIVLDIAKVVGLSSQIKRIRENLKTEPL